MLPNSIKGSVKKNNELMKLTDPINEIVRINYFNIIRLDQF